MGEDVEDGYCIGTGTTADWDDIVKTGRDSHTLRYVENTFSTRHCVSNDCWSASIGQDCPCGTTSTVTRFSSFHSPVEEQRAASVRRPHRPIVSALPSDIYNASARTENIRKKIIDDGRIKSGNGSAAIIHEAKTNRRKWRCFHGLLPSYLFTPFSAESPSIDEPHRKRPIRHSSDRKDERSNDKDDGIRFNDRLTIRTGLDRRSGHSKMMGDDYRNCGSALVSTLLIVLLIFSLPPFSIISGCDASSVKRDQTSIGANGAVVDQENVELRPRRHHFKKMYTNQWAVEIIDGSDEIAEQIGRRHGFTYLGHIFGHYYLFTSDRVRTKRSTRRARYLQYEFGREPQVIWLEQQVAKRRVKRDFQIPNVGDDKLPKSRGTIKRSSSPQRRDNPMFLEQQQQQPVGRNRDQIARQAISPCSETNDPRLQSSSGCPDSAAFASAASSSLPYGDRSRQYLDDLRHRLAFSAANGAWNVLGPGGVSNAAVGYKTPNDPEWTEMWYLNRGSGLDHNVREAWYLGVTGRDIVVTILDDGLEHNHPDIVANYDPQASYDINDSDTDPMPRYDLSNENRHGTRCAGEVAAVYNNTQCIVGIAFGARIGGIRMLDGEVTDAVEAASLSHNRDHIDIYSASWGPDDDGKTVDGPARMAQQAFRDGILHGRRGKGSIFVWASGNGGRDADSCNCDGYTNSIYTLSISSATENGNVPWYSEACSSTLASTYSSGSHSEKMIVTTDLHHGCTNSHTGTSASAPLAAGICALALEANPKLTWRDLQHIVVRTARPEHLKANDWVMNGVGRNVSHSFGFGLMDAGGMVRLAKNWTLAPPQRRCAVRYEGGVKQIPQKTTLQVTLTTDGCADDDPDTRVAYLEHVQARITLSAQKRGDIQIFLTSPQGTKSTLLAKRARDGAKTGFRDWAFMTTHCWGETALGIWKLEIQNDGFSDATLFKWELVMYGTSIYVGPFGALDAGSGVTNNHVQRSEGSLWSAHSNSAVSSVLLPTNCCLTTPLGLCAVCPSGSALYQNECIGQCPTFHYMHRQLSKINPNASSCFEYARCVLCHPSCTKCTGPTDADCHRCVVGYGRNVGGRRCLRRSRNRLWNGYKRTGNGTGTYRRGGPLPPNNVNGIKLGLIHILSLVGVVGLVVVGVIIVYQFWLLKKGRRLEWGWIALPLAPIIRESNI